MNYRVLGKTNWEISEISLGTWQVGGKWGSDFDHSGAEKILHSAIDQGVNFIDTADVYSAGLSEATVAKVIRERSEEVYLATKAGRRLNPHNAEGYNKENLTSFVEDSLKNTGMEALDLLQLHCPPSTVYRKVEMYEILDDLKKEGKIREYGVSVEKVSEAMEAIQHPGVASVQIIFNLFRLKPAEQFFQEAKKNNVGIIARVPLASGLLTGKFDENTTFEKGDHRNFNRNGEAFDKGETFSGLGFEKGLAAVKEYKRLFGEKFLTKYALRWILMHPEVSTIIPGASKEEHVISNIEAGEIPPLPEMAMQDVLEVYNANIKPHVHHLW
ncbi:MAG: aldo/keto reductase [Bacteroidia bacterium]|nr:aldo/keto reductase [Bacteroidia bacterium]